MRFVVNYRHKRKLEKALFALFVQYFFSIFVWIASLVIYNLCLILIASLGGLGITCSRRYRRFAGSNPTESDGFFPGRKNSKHMSSKREFKLWAPSPRFQAC